MILFVAVVFLGIEVGSIGAKISKIENSIEELAVEKRDIAENIFKKSGIVEEEKIAELGFNKPSNVIYFDTEEIIAKLPVR